MDNKERQGKALTLQPAHIWPINKWLLHVNCNKLLHRARLRLHTWLLFEINYNLQIWTFDMKSAHICLSAFLPALRDLPLLNPVSLLERLSAWTLQLQQASCQARFLRNTQNDIQTWRNTWGTRWACTHTRTHRGGSNTGSKCHSRFIWKVNRHNCEG